jgi:DNA (cytosine-5)-methyltransferase 1
MTKNGENRFNVIDLFSGVGGLSLGAERAGFTVRGAIDVDEETINVHKINFPNTAHFNIDISTLNGQNLKELCDIQNREIFGIIGGPPCQGFSSIGKRDKNDTRNLLFAHFFRIVSEARPVFFLAENVPGIMRDDNEEIRSNALRLVEDTYEILPPITVTASDYGAPTIRKRVFFLGYRREEMETVEPDDFSPDQKTKQITVQEALKWLPKKIKPEWQDEDQGWRVVRGYDNTGFAEKLHACVPSGIGYPRAIERLRNENRVSGCLGTRHSKELEERYARIENGKSDPISKSYRLDLKGFCPTLRAGTGPDHGSFQAVRPLHPTENRVITPREAARLQGFPDWFQFSPTKWHSFRQIGSSVSPLVAESFLTVLQKALGSPNKNEEVWNE